MDANNDKNPTVKVHTRFQPLANSHELMEAISIVENLQRDLIFFLHHEKDLSYPTFRICSEFVRQMIDRVQNDIKVYNDSKPKN